MNTIIESGLTTLTRPVGNLEFSFDEFTRKMELINFFSYCREYNLLTTDGEHSRLSLIRKTYNHMLSANYASSSIAEQEWLQLKTSSTSTDRETLWKLYFAQHATTPDEQGLTYAGLSLEAAYRKFLDEYIGEIFTFDENAYITELLSFRLGKVFQDSSTVSEVVSFLKQIYRQASDTCQANETVAILINKRLTDTSGIIDQLHFNITKTFYDQIVVNETYDFTGLDVQDEDSLSTSENNLVQDRVSISVIKVLADLNSVADAIFLRKDITRSDTATMSDSFSYIIGLFQNMNEVIQNEDVALILMNKRFYDGLSIEDDVIWGYVTFGAGKFWSYYFGA
jgi:hypothetical protein